MDHDMPSRRDFMKRSALAPLGAVLGVEPEIPLTDDAPDRAPQEAPLPWVDARDFGATGNGSANAAPALQRAIDSLAGARGVVVIPAGNYRCDGDLDARRAHLVGMGIPGSTGGGGTTLRFTARHGIRSSVEDDYGYAISSLRITGSARRAQNGQILVNFTGQNYPRVRDCRVARAETGLRLENGRRVECHYGTFYNVSIDQCYTGVDIPGWAHSHKFFGGRFWNCVYGVRNAGANDIVFFGTEFESDTPLWHPPPSGSTNPATMFVGSRQESDRAPIIESGYFSDVGSYWSGYRRPAAFDVRQGETQLRGRIHTTAIQNDNHPVSPNFLRNAHLVPGPDGETLPGWKISSGVPRPSMGPFGRMIHFDDVESSTHSLEQDHIRLPAGSYYVGYGFQTEGEGVAGLYVYDGDRLLLDAARIPGTYAGGIVQRSFALATGSDRIRVRLQRNGIAGTRIYYYAPYIIPSRAGEAFGAVSADRPNEVRYGDGPPRAGSWQVGDVVHNTTPTPGGFIGWVCVAPGAPGDWKGFGRIET